MSATNEQGLFPTAAGRVFNVFCFFTVCSNLLVAVTSLMALARPERDGEWFSAFRLAGIVAIAVTFVVFHTALKHLVDLDGWAKVADQLLHTLAPICAVAGWIVGGPRGLTTPRIALLALVPAAAWLAFALVRGELIDYYPYPFVDVAEHGYVRVAANAALIGALFYGLARGAVWLDRRLGLRAAV